ncbi:MAG: DUF4215 domain-containing protein [Pseudomonadota bacterium]
MPRTGRKVFLVVTFCSSLVVSCAKIAGGPGGGGGATGNDGGQVDLSRPIGDSVIIPDSIGMTCGNGSKDNGENCDDGNKAAGDGCTPLCQLEADWDCKTVGQPCVNLAKCGDGKQSSSEGCDDGNNAAGDGCTADCKVESGYQCRVPGKHCVPLCGDKMIIGAEKCDDGNAMNGDGCSSTCLLEPGATCPAAGQACSVAVCGNSKMEAGESCDAGPLNGLFLGNGTGCSKTCTKEPLCRTGATTRACDVTCGNGNIETGEDCDDGNQANGDGCTSACKNETGFSCSPEMKPDTEDCAPPATGKCLRLPLVYRDFKNEKETGGHPDFFWFGAPINPAPAINNAGFMHNGMAATHANTTFKKRYCISDSGGPAKANDSTARCWDIASPTLDTNGKPTFNASRTNGNLCPCQFTDWSHVGNGGHVPGYTNDVNGPLGGTDGPGYIGGPDGHPIYRGYAPIVKDAASFSQWFNDSTASVRSVGTLQLSPVMGGYQFTSDSHTIYGGFFPLDPPGNMFPVPGRSMTGPGATRTVMGSNEALTCNLWPYWYSSTGFGAGANCKGDQYLFPPSVDATTMGCPATTPAGEVPCKSGTWVPQVQGWFHNFYFSTEVRYLFTHNAAFELNFYGDDDLFIYINGKLVLDLGAIHRRLPGRVQVSDAGVATITEGGSVNFTTGIINPCPGTDPISAMPTTSPADCRQRTLDLGLMTGRTYEIAVFHADRAPAESNYQLTLSGFATNRSNCTARCGDMVVTGAEECDEGPMNNDATYGGCSTMCKFGPFCGDGVKSDAEQCDLGKNNGTPYGNKDGCTTGCTFPHYCGDSTVDTFGGEQCDQGAAVNGTQDSMCDAFCKIKIG